MNRFNRIPAASRVGLVVLMILSTGCVLQPIRVEGVAMEPTLADGDRAMTPPR